MAHNPSYDNSKITLLFLEKSGKPVDNNLTMADFEVGNQPTYVIDASQERVGMLKNPYYDQKTGLVGYEYFGLDAR